MLSPTSPQHWRKAQGLSLAGAAKLAAVPGRNPARDWQRWEIGMRQPPASVIDLIEGLSGGVVTARSWARVRADYLARPIDPKQAEPHAA